MIVHASFRARRCLIMNLKRRIQEAGLLRKAPWYYALSISTNLVMFTAVLVVLFTVHIPWLQALDAVALGWVSGQLGFQLHDAGHRQMFDRGWKNTLVGFLTGDVLLGMSYSWWVSKHNRHHANPNNVEDDPDIGPGAISYTREQALSKRGPLRKLAAYQAFFFFPCFSSSASACTSRGSSSWSPIAPGCAGWNWGR